MKKTKGKNNKPPMNFDMDFEPPPQDVEKWYTSLPADPEEFPSCPTDKLEQLKEEAKNYLISDSNGYSIKASKSSEQNWMRSVMAQGTGKDKMAALTIMIQEKPLYNISALQSLIGLIKLGKKECANCIDTLVELFVSDLLPPDKKLKKFSQRPLMLLDKLSSGNPAGRRRRLVLWYFEDQLKDTYKVFLDAVRLISTDSVEANKEKAIKALGTLLGSHPEQEATLLSILVNKMGDPLKKVASRSMLCLTHVLSKHPNMKGVIINEVEKLLFRPNVGHKARYYGICFLSQILFTKADAQIAANIIKLYLSFFKACVKLGDVDSKMLGVLLSGVNRAYPYAKEAMDSISEQLDTLYKIVHIAPFHVSLQGLTLLFQVSDYKNNVSDRFYSVLYRKLLDPALGNASHAPMFLNLVFQALKKDESVPRVKAFIKRLLQVCCYLPVPMACATLYMISQLCLKDTLKASSFQPNMVKEECEVKPSEAMSAALLEDDSEDEHYDDVPLDENEAAKQKKVKKASKSDQTVKDDAASAAWVYKTNSSNKSKSDGYDPMHRNPLYANADLSCYSELSFLSRHFHPTVALFASHLINEEANSYDGDPLKDFTLVRFLERFSFKNPKKLPENVPSLFAKRKKYASTGVRSLPVRSESYLKQKEDNVPVDEKYLFTYLQNRRAAAPDQDDKDSDAESIGDEEFDGILDKMMQKRGFKKDMDEDLDLNYSDIDEDLDFADEYTKNMTSKKTKKKSAEDDDGDDISGSDDEEEEEGDDEGGDFGDEDNDDFGDEDEDDFVDDGGDDVILNGKTKRKDKKQKDFDDYDDEEMPSDFDDYDDDGEDIDFGDDSEDEGPKAGKNRKKMKYDDVFASAEEFSELIEAAGNARDGTSSAVSNKDKASFKQLDWEAKRDRSMKGFGRKGPGKGSKKGKGKPAGVKRSSFKPKKNGRR
ncbi:CCAAT/enhancer-binding protein zeta-like [Thrips palmi]|uniref:CCAAT/enhancer-binding protein zeta n=1 Tax=Thrips palmi TaxID=161013 RepID=A0A6P8ZAW5_THRPL|nr:CCAAT/enhancer-binding protein zeta-like [Thrips palmi]